MLETINYCEFAKALNCPNKSMVGGKYASTVGGRVFETRNPAETIALANATKNGLTAPLYTRDLNKAHRYVHKLEAETAGVNAYSEREVSTPFGGFKASGFGGRDNGIQVHKQYTELKTLWITLND